MCDVFDYPTRTGLSDSAANPNLGSSTEGGSSPETRPRPVPLDGQDAVTLTKDLVERAFAKHFTHLSNEFENEASFLRERIKQVRKDFVEKGQSAAAAKTRRSHLRKRGRNLVNKNLVLQPQELEEELVDGWSDEGEMVTASANVSPPADPRLAHGSLSPASPDDLLCEALARSPKVEATQKLPGPEVAKNLVKPASKSADEVSRPTAFPSKPETSAVVSPSSMSSLVTLQPCIGHDTVNSIPAEVLPSRPSGNNVIWNVLEKPSSRSDSDLSSDHTAELPSESTNSSPASSTPAPVSQNPVPPKKTLFGRVAGAAAWVGIKAVETLTPSPIKRMVSEAKENIQNRWTEGVEMARRKLDEWKDALDRANEEYLASQRAYYQGQTPDGPQVFFTGYYNTGVPGTPIVYTVPQDFIQTQSGYNYTITHTIQVVATAAEDQGGCIIEEIDDDVEYDEYEVEEDVPDYPQPSHHASSSTSQQPYVRPRESSKDSVAVGRPLDDSIPPSPALHNVPPVHTPHSRYPNFAHSTPYTRNPGSAASPDPDQLEKLDSAISVSPDGSHDDIRVSLSIQAFQQIIESAVAEQVASVRDRFYLESQRMALKINELERDVVAKTKKQLKEEAKLNTMTAKRKHGKKRVAFSKLASKKHVHVADDVTSTELPRRPAVDTKQVIASVTPENLASSAKDTVEDKIGGVPQQNSRTPERESHDLALNNFEKNATATQPEATNPTTESAHDPASRAPNAPKPIIHPTNCSCPEHPTIQDRWRELFLDDVGATRRQKANPKTVTWAKTLTEVFRWSVEDEDEVEEASLEQEPKTPEDEPKTPTPNAPYHDESQPSPSTSWDTKSEPEDPTTSAESISSAPINPPRSQKWGLFGMASMATSVAWSITSAPPRLFIKTSTACAGLAIRATSRTASALWHIREGGVTDLMVDAVDATFDVAQPWIDAATPWLGFVEDEIDRIVPRIELKPGLPITAGQVVRSVRRAAGVSLGL
ncbi:hypothetical protein HDU96_010694 [Phlyctochytrium bullatum]|nr:hypothetical protein HDU96_010694 [Phlyctochytrium bullatum]